MYFLPYHSVTDENSVLLLVHSNMSIKIDYISSKYHECSMNNLKDEMTDAFPKVPLVIDAMFRLLSIPERREILNYIWVQVHFMNFGKRKTYRYYFRMRYNV